MADQQLDIPQILDDEHKGVDPETQAVFDQWRLQGKIPPKRMDVKGKGTVPPPTQPLQSGITPPPSTLGKIGNFAYDTITSPEGIAGIASMVPGVGTLGAGAIGAGSSIYQDLNAGETRPSQIALHAGVHGGLSMVPGGIANVAEKGLGSVASAAMHAVPGGKWVAAALSRLGGGEGPAAAEKIITAPSNAIAEYATPEALAQIKSHVLNLASQGKAYGDPAFDAADALYRRAMNYVEQHGYDPATLAKTAGLDIKTASQKAADAAAHVVNAAKDRASHYANLAKIMTSTASPYIFGTPSSPVTPPPTSKP